MQFKINRKMILSISSTPEVFFRGEQCYENDETSEMVVEEDYDTNSLNVCAKVHGQFKDYDVKLGFSQDGFFRRYSCNCDGYGVWKGCCKHVVAVLFNLLYVKDIEQSTIIDNKRAQNITRVFETTLYEDIATDKIEILEEGKKARVIPYISIQDENNVFLKLKVGFEREYAVKNIKNLITNIKGDKTVTYGKNLTFKHSLSSFDDKSKKLLTLFIDMFAYLAEFEKMSQIFSYRTISLNISESLLVSKKMLDDLFDIYENDAVSIDFTQKHLYSEFKRPVKFVTDKPDIKFKLIFSETEIALLSQKIPFKLLHGEKYNYFFDFNNLYRTNKQYTKIVSPILTETNNSKNGEIIFKEQDFSKFLSFVLPKLRKFDLLDESTVFPASISVFEVAPKLYLDIAGKNVTCKVLFCYGDLEINPLIKSDANVFRDTLEEIKVVNLLDNLAFKAEPKESLYVLSGDEQIFNLYYFGLEKLKENAEIFATNEFNRREIKATQKPSFGVSIAGNLLELSFDELPYSVSELLDVVNAYKLKKRFHRLKSGQFVNLDDENVKAYSDTLSLLDINKKDIKDDIINLQAFRAFHLENVLSANENADVARDETFKALIDNVLNYKADKNLKVPAELEKTMRGYQKTGFKWLTTLSKLGFSGILADEMGLGKTLQVISVLLSENETKTHPSIVVTPTSLMYNWESEIEKFAPSINVVILNGTPQKRLELFKESKDVDVFITTYDMLKRDIANYDKTTFNYVIADEAQYIKNPVTQNAVALKRLKSHCRFALTGTPIENSLGELWSIFDFLMPGYLYNASKFSKLYETPIVKHDDTHTADLLQKQIAPFILRRMKKDVLKELPEKVETTLYAALEPEQQKIYSYHLLKARGELDETLNGEKSNNKIEILALLTRLRQICDHPSTFIEDYKGGSGKLNVTIETILSAVESNHRVLLFSQFTSMLAILKTALDAHNIPYFYLDGATESKQRTVMAAKFNEGEKPVFLVSLKAGGTGLNLTGANIVIHYDQWWNPAVMDQAADRAHRYGQKNVVQVINVIAKDTIEEKIIKLQEKKKQLTDSVLSQGANFINKMSAEELKALFSQ